MRLFNTIVVWLRYLKQKYITKARQTPRILGTREEKPGGFVIKNHPSGAIISAKNLININNKGAALVEKDGETQQKNYPSISECPYCQGKDVVKRGWRKKKYEKAQLYFCNHCQKTFTGQKVKGKSFPLRVIFEGIGFYNLGYSLEESCLRLKEQFGLETNPSTLADWVKEFEPLCRYARLRPYALKLYSPAQIIQTAHLFHHQVYDFSVHRGKLALLLQEYRNNKFDNLREFLEAIQSECPHQFFKEGLRASELKVGFSPAEVIIKEKQNFATRLAGLALQAVSDNKLRHKALQDFMLRNDSVTVAVEVPVYMDQMDVEHMQEELKFKIPIKLDKEGSRAFVQLTLYALMLSRLTGLRLYDFKCAWFDENSYFEFFPLHVVYKLRQRAKKEHPDQIRMDFKEQEEVDAI